jgi:hypothetical protein
LADPDYYQRIETFNLGLLQTSAEKRQNGELKGRPGGLE